MLQQEIISVATQGRGTYDITSILQDIVQKSAITTGMCNIFVHHTSASLILCENADPRVREDLETFMARIAPDGDPSYLHNDEGPDDMPAHIRSILTQNSLYLPVTKGRCGLGTWQGVYLWEHRAHGYQRRVTVTVHD